MKRWLLGLVAAAAALCTVGALLATRRPNASAVAPPVRRAHPLVLRMPFERGTVVWLMQGNQAPAGHTHRRALPQNEFALDFASPVEDVVTVLSAAAGRATFSFDAADPEDVAAGAGYGNQIKIDHGDGRYTFYAHLDSVTVARGDRVPVGAPVGTMGRTGRAGIRHLHFSLHEAPADELGGRPSLLIERLVTLDVTAADPVFRRLRGDQLVLDYRQQFNGHIYASENSVSEPLLEGPLPVPLRQQITEQAARTRAALDLQLRLDAIAHRKGEPVPWYRAELESIAASDPEHPVMLYLRAVTVEIPSSQWSAAERSLLAAQISNRAARRYLPWLPGRVHYQLGLLARRAGHGDAARKHLERAVALSVSARQLEDAQRELEQTPAP